MPDQPSSTIFAHVPRSKPSALSASRSLRSCEIGAFVPQNDFAVSLSMFCSSLRIIGIGVPLPPLLDPGASPLHGPAVRAGSGPSRPVSVDPPSKAWMKTDSIPLVERALARARRDALHATLPMGRIEVQTLPGCPDLRLGLINADFPTGPLPPDVMHAVIRAARLLGVVLGQRSGAGAAAVPASALGARVAAYSTSARGSGVVGIAALRNGAASVVGLRQRPRRARRHALPMRGSTACDIEVCADLAELRARLRSAH